MKKIYTMTEIEWMKVSKLMTYTYEYNYMKSKQKHTAYTDVEFRAP